MLEVTVKGYKINKVFQREGDKLVVNVANTNLSTAGFAADVLKKTARVQVKSDNSVNIFGKGKAIILVDGLENNNPEVLNSLSSDEIQSIEIMTNPPAKYSASGKAIINIITNKQHELGLNGRFNNYLTKATYLRSYTNVDLSFKKDKLTLYTKYNYNPYKIRYEDEYFRKIYQGDQIVNTLRNTIKKDRTFLNEHNYKIGLDLQLNPRHALGLQFRGANSGNKEFTTDINDVFTPEIVEPTTIFSTDTDTDVNYNSQNYNLNYTYLPDTLGQKLDVIFDLSFYSDQKKDNIKEQITSIDNQYDLAKSNLNINDIEVATFKLNYAAPIFNNSLFYEAGFKYSSIRSLGLNDFRHISSNVSTIDPNRSSKFNYNETIGAAFLTINKKLDKLNLKAGLRLENNTMRGNTTNLNTDNKIDRTAFQLFPSFFVDYSISKDLILDLSYTKRISRPTFQDLNPFITYIDSLSFYQGNPTLIPEIVHSFETGITYREYASINLGYSNRINPMFLAIDLSSTTSGAAIVSTQNFKSAKKYFVILNLPYQIKGWTTFNSIGWSSNRLEQLNTENQLVVRQKPLLYLYMYNELKLPYGIAVDFTYQYNSSGIDGIFQFEPRHTVSFGIGKSFLDKKLNVRLVGNDLFNQNQIQSTARVQNLEVDYKSFYDAKYFRLIVSYKFGTNFYSFKNKSENDDELNRIKGN